jgi:hypothetical protein
MNFQTFSKFNTNQSLWHYSHESRALPFSQILTRVPWREFGEGARGGSPFLAVEELAGGDGVAGST